MPPPLPEPHDSMSAPAPIVSLLSPEQIAGLRRRSDAKGLTRLAAHLAVLALTGALVTLTQGSAWMVGALWLHGVVLVFLFAPLHESVHYTAFATRWLNRRVADVVGFLLLLPSRYFRAFHLAHHRHTQDPERDPELASPKPRTRGELLLAVSGLPLWRERVATLLQHSRGRVDEPFIEPAQRRRIMWEARVHLLLYLGLGVASFALPTGVLLWYWLVPTVIAQPMLRIFLLAEHTGCPLVPDMLRNSRTTHSNALVRFLAWNMPYHSEHHTYAAVPFHALPALHEHLKDRIAVQSPGYARTIRGIAADLRAAAPG